MAVETMMIHFFKTISFEAEIGFSGATGWRKR
jgi:hypothetical protein